MKDRIIPCTSTSANSSSGVITPAKVSTANAADWIAANTWVILIIVRMFTRSAMAPATGPITTTGSKSATVIRPSQKPEPVISQVSHITAARCAQVPLCDSTLPIENAR